MKTPADGAPGQLLAYLRLNPIDVEFLAPGVPMPTVASAAAAIGVPEEQILKTLLFVGDAGDHVVAIASGTRRVDRKLLAQVTGLIKPRAAKPESVFEITGYPAGGVAPFGLAPHLRVVVDSVVTGLPVAFGGGGRDHLLLRVNPLDVVRLNNAIVATIVEQG
jgi:Cys-tRNA(Pro) deacylase